MDSTDVQSKLSAIEESKSPEVNHEDENFEKGKEKEYLEYFIHDHEKASRLITDNLSCFKSNLYLNRSNTEEIWAAAEASSIASKQLIFCLEYFQREYVQNLVEFVKLQRSQNEIDSEKLQSSRNRMHSDELQHSEGGIDYIAEHNCMRNEIDHSVELQRLENRIDSAELQLLKDLADSDNYCESLQGVVDSIDQKYLQNVVDSVGLLIIGNNDGSPDFNEDIIPALAWLGAIKHSPDFEKIEKGADPLWKFCSTKPPEHAKIKRRLLRTSENSLSGIKVTRSKYCYVYILKDPLITDVKQAIRSIMECDFASYRGIYYGGHGTEDGDWVFRDREDDQDAVLTLEDFSSCFPQKCEATDILMYSCNSHRWFHDWNRYDRAMVRMKPTSWYDCSTVPLKLSDVEKTSSIFRYLDSLLIEKREQYGKEVKSGSRAKKIPDLQPVIEVKDAKQLDGSFRIYTFSVKSADCTLVVIDNGQFVILIDGAYHMAKNHVFLKNCWGVIGKLKRIDLVIVTHIDNDHIGGVLAILKLLESKKVDEHCPEIKEIWFNQCNPTIFPKKNHKKKGRGVPESNELYEIIQRQVMKKDGLKYKRAWRKCRHLTKDIKLNILTPTKKELKEFDLLIEPKGEQTNKVSISFIVEFGNKKALFTADAPSLNVVEGVKKLYGNEQIEVDYADVPHHSSYESFDIQLPKQIKSKFWVISGNHEYYNHPHPDTVKKLLQNKDTVWLSSRNPRIEELFKDAKFSTLKFFDQKYTYEVFDLLP